MKTAREILGNPPYWIREAYMPGYLRGTISINTLTCAVAAEQGRSPYEVDDLVSEVQEAIEELGLDRAPAVLV